MVLWQMQNRNGQNKDRVLRQVRLRLAKQTRMLFARTFYLVQVIGCVSHWKIVLLLNTAKQMTEV